MSTILYYSNYCNNCKQLLHIIARWGNIKDDIHFINIDKRVPKPNGTINVVLENGQEILLPPTITKVPALLLLNKGHQVLFGAAINKHLEPKQVAAAQVATQNNGEPMAFTLGTAFGGFGVVSDNFSFLDQDSESLAAKGTGGLRQQHHYATMDYNCDIQTPPDNWAPDKVGPVSIEQLEQKRQKETQQQPPSQMHGRQ
jgi:hypothetical protein